MSLAKLVQAFPGAHALYARARDALRVRRLLRAEPELARLRRDLREPGAPAVLFYCEHASHLQSIEALLGRLLERGTEFRCALLLGPDLPEAVARQAPGPLAAVPIARCSRPALAALDAALLLTPVVGLLPRYRPCGARVAHLLVSLAGLEGFYADGDFDGYDFLLCAGPHQQADFRALRARRPQLAGKVLVPAGYPKLDWTRARAAARKPEPEPGSVVYAPTHVYAVNERLCSLRGHGAAIVRALLGAGHRVVFRPHPASMRDQDRGLVEAIAAEHAGNPRFALDLAGDYMESYSQSSLLLTDVSGTAFTYAFTFERPVLFFETEAGAGARLQGLHLDERERIGRVVGDIEGLLAAVPELGRPDAPVRDAIRALRARSLHRLDDSADYLAAQLPAMLSGVAPPEWTRL